MGDPAATDLVRLLLDEMYPAAAARALRDAGYDVIAVQEDPGLRAVDDEALFRVAQEMARALVTENVNDFAPLAAALDAGGDSHHGLVFTSNRAFPRHGPRFIGAFVTSVGQFLDAHPTETPGSLVSWLGPAPT